MSGIPLTRTSLGRTLPAGVAFLLFAVALRATADAATPALAPKARRVASEPPKARPLPVAALRATPPQVRLRGPFAEARLLVDARLSDGSVRDVSARLAWSVADPAIASLGSDRADPDSAATLRPGRDGATTLIGRFQGREVRVPVRVDGLTTTGGPPVAHRWTPRFLTDVLPVLTKAGCNQGACHGAAAGKGGFRLSLLGYDPAFDHESITRFAGARRINLARPEESLLLRKSTFRMRHGGGQRFALNSPEYRLLLTWIRSGLPGPAADEPSVTRLEALPGARTMAVGETQWLLVRATYSDGTQRDVSGQTLFSASDPTTASVTPEGEAQAIAPGEGAVVIRYRGAVTTARVIAPFGKVSSANSREWRRMGRRSDSIRNPGRQEPRKSGEEAKNSLLSSIPPGFLPSWIPDRFFSIRSAPTLRAGTQREFADHSSPAPWSRMDDLVFEKLAALGLEASGPCSDAEFVRRAYLDVIGLLPRPEETRAFLWSQERDKRQRLIEALLSRPEYVDFWSLKWGDLLRNSRRALGDKGMYAFQRWLRASVVANKGWDRIARELLLSEGSGYDVGPANYYRVARTPEELAETTSQVFLGVRVQCARCHNHPFEKWTQNQYYQMAAFFARVKAKDGERPEETEVYLAATGEVSHPKTRKTMTPTALDATPVPADFHGDRREPLVDWLTSPENPFFAHILVNRVWRHFMGRGLVEPVDDLRATNPPTNAALFDWLANDFVQHGYDVKHLIRAITQSQTYQRSARPTAANAQDTRYYSHYPFKRLGAEQLLDALVTVTGVPEKFEGLPLGTRAAQLPDPAVSSYFLDLFGRPARQITCECERSEEPGLAQVLHLMNSEGLNDRLTSKKGRVAALLGADLPPRQIVDELYLATVSRFPSPEESRNGIRALTAAQDRQRATEDLLWALLNMREFLFNH